MSIVDNYYKHNLFLLEELMEITTPLEYFELSVFNVAPLSSIIYNYPEFRVEDHYTQTDIIECYHATSNPDYKLFQMLINHFKLKGVELLWLGSPIFLGNFEAGLIYM